MNPRWVWQYNIGWLVWRLLYQYMTGLYFVDRGFNQSMLLWCQKRYTQEVHDAASFIVMQAVAAADCLLQPLLVAVLQLLDDATGYKGCLAVTFFVASIKLDAEPWRCMRMRQSRALAACMLGTDT